jgi:hypothetical protein
MGTLTAFPGRNLSSNFRFSGWGAPVAEAEPLLEARNLVKQYGQVLALDGANFTAYPRCPSSSAAARRYRPDQTR